jgi:hypothetical protein
MPQLLDGSNEPVPLRELCDQYEQHWLLVKILDWTVPEGDQPCILLAHDPSRAAMFRAERKFRKQDPTACLSIVGGGPKFGTLEPLRQAIARIAAGEEEWVSVNPW